MRFPSGAVLPACAVVLAARLAAFAGDPLLAPVIRNGPEGCRAVALTFDLCPVVKGSGWDRALVELLRDRQIPATFFASGRWIAQHDSEVRTLLAVPFFELGTHGQRHRHLPALDAVAQRAEIADAAELLSTHYSRRPTLFRAPYGEFDDRARAVVATLGGRLVQWSVVSGDPDPRVTAGRMLRALRASVRDGSIVIFHANGKGAHTREVVDTLVTQVLPERGLAPETVSGLLEGCDGASW